MTTYSLRARAEILRLRMARERADRIRRSTLVVAAGRARLGEDEVREIIGATLRWGSEDSSYRLGHSPDADTYESTDTGEGFRTLRKLEAFHVHAPVSQGLRPRVGRSRRLSPSVLDSRHDGGRSRARARAYLAALALAESRGSDAGAKLPGSATVGGQWKISPPALITAPDAPLKTGTREPIWPILYGSTRAAMRREDRWNDCGADQASRLAALARLDARITARES